MMENTSTKVDQKDHLNTSVMRPKIGHILKKRNSSQVLMLGKGWVTIPDLTPEMRNTERPRRHSDWNILGAKDDGAAGGDNRSACIHEDPFSDVKSS